MNRDGRAIERESNTQIELTLNVPAVAGFGTRSTALREATEAQVPDKKGRMNLCEPIRKTATPSKLFLDERVEHCGPSAFEVTVPLETLPKQCFDSLQRLGPG